jgi:hypothetical protein
MSYFFGGVRGTNPGNFTPAARNRSDTSTNFASGVNFPGHAPEIASVEVPGAAGEDAKLHLD